MRLLYFLVASLFLFSCGRKTAKKPVENDFDGATSGGGKTHQTSKEYTSQKWHFSAIIPEGFKVHEDILPDGSPVINFYDKGDGNIGPMAISNNASQAYIAVLPKGFGNDAPGGPRIPLEAWDKLLPVTFSYNLQESFVYLLENGKPWALSLKFYIPPVNWGENAEIFIVYKVDDFESRCFSSNSGEEILLEDCNAVDGDTQKFYGTISEEKRTAINDILENFYFENPRRKREVLTNLIKIETPSPGEKIKSPLKVLGKAKGTWLFEATAPVILVGEDSEIIARGYIQAKGDWMTTNWVDFEGILEFKTQKKRGQLIFSRANPADQPEFDRQLRIPVVLE